MAEQVQKYCIREPDLRRPEDLTRLLNNACLLIIREAPVQVTVLYRDKNEDYWDHVDAVGLEPTSKKAVHGHQSNPLNELLWGVYYSVSLYKAQLLPTISFFGTHRRTMPIETMFTAETRLYFNDFHCNIGYSDDHTITLIACRPDSEPDKFCRANSLPLLPWHNTNYQTCPIFHQNENGEFFVASLRGIWVHIFWTEQVPIGWYVGDTEIMPSTAGGTNSGCDNRRLCTTCNFFERITKPVHADTLGDKLA